MKCRHRHSISFVWRIGGGDVPRWFDAASFEAPDAQKCINCGAWLPLGPARDTPETAVEVEAARLAIERGSFGYDRFDYCPQTMTDELCSHCEALYLAHQIARHISEHDGEGR